MMNEKIPVSEYKVDYSKNPIWVDLIGKNKKNGQIMALFGLIEFVDSTTIKWEVFPTEEKRPEKFSEKNKTKAIILHKK